MGKKPIILALNIANKFNIKNLKQLDSTILRLLESTKKSERTKLKSIGKNVLLEYLSENEELRSKTSLFFDIHLHPSELSDRNNLSQTPKFKTQDKEQLALFSKNLDGGNKFSIDQILNFYFDKSEKIPFELILSEILSNYDTNLIELSHKLRKFELIGIVKHLMDYGCYIKPSSFKTEKLLFLHKYQITEKREITHPNEIIKENETITFRIIGINQQNHRLNISCLEIFNPS